MPTLIDDFSEHLDAVTVEINEILVSNITWERWTGRDQYGVDTFAAAVTVKSRVRDSIETLRDDDGREIVSQRQLWIRAQTTDLDAKDRFTVEGESPPVLSVERVPYQGKLVWFTVFLGKNQGPRSGSL